jgi:hypothetical protein
LLKSHNGTANPEHSLHIQFEERGQFFAANTYVNFAEDTFTSTVDGIAIIIISKINRYRLQIMSHMLIGDMIKIYTAIAIEQRPLTIRAAGRFTELPDPIVPRSAIKVHRSHLLKSWAINVISALLPPLIQPSTVFLVKKNVVRIVIHITLDVI